MKITVKQSSRAYKVPVKVVRNEVDDHYDVMEPDDFDDMLPRGKGDPDFYGYPGERDE